MYYEINAKQLKLLLFTQLLCTGSVMLLLMQEQEYIFSFAITVEQMAILLLSLLGSGLLLRTTKSRYVKPYLIGLNLLGIACTLSILTVLFML